jgi:hypothetical protein
MTFKYLVLKSEVSLQVHLQYITVHLQYITVHLQYITVHLQYITVHLHSALPWILYSANLYFYHLFREIQFH